MIERAPCGIHGCCLVLKTKVVEASMHSHKGLLPFLLISLKNRDICYKISLTMPGLSPKEIFMVFVHVSPRHMFTNFKKNINYYIYIIPIILKTENEFCFKFLSIIIILRFLKFAFIINCYQEDGRFV